MNVDRHVPYERRRSDVEKRDRLDLFRELMRKEIDTLPKEVISENYQAIRSAIIDDENSFMDDPDQGFKSPPSLRGNVPGLVSGLTRSYLERIPLTSDGKEMRKKLLEIFSLPMNPSGEDLDDPTWELSAMCDRILDAQTTLDRIPAIIESREYGFAYKLFRRASDTLEHDIGAILHFANRQESSTFKDSAYPGEETAVLKAKNVRYGLLINEGSSVRTRLFTQAQKVDDLFAGVMARLQAQER